MCILSALLVCLRIFRLLADPGGAGEKLPGICRKNRGLRNSFSREVVLARFSRTNGSSDECVAGAAKNGVCGTSASRRRFRSRRLSGEQSRVATRMAASAAGLPVKTRGCEALFPFGPVFVRVPAEARAAPAAILVPQKAAFGVRQFFRTVSLLTAPPFPLSAFCFPLSFLRSRLRTLNSRLPP